MNWWKQFKAKSCSVKLKGSDKSEVLQAVVEQLSKAGDLDDKLAKKASQALTDREALASTGVGMNVAIPHVKTELVNEFVGVLGRSRDGIRSRHDRDGVG